MTCVWVHGMISALYLMFDGGLSNVGQCPMDAPRFHFIT